MHAHREADDLVPGIAAVGKRPGCMGRSLG
jgi:hypothetical protein